MSEAKPKNRTAITITVIVLICAATWAIVHFFVAKPDFTYAGTLEATEIDLPARVPSVITAINVQEGDAIKKDQVLVTLGCEDVKLAADFNKSNFERVEKLFKAGTVPRDQFDQAQNRKQDTDVRLSWCQIHSPIVGRVLTRYLEPGEWVNPGSRLLSVADIHDIWAYIYVPQGVIHELKLGQKIDGVLPEMKDHKFTGTIRKINSEAEFTPKNVQTEAERERLVFGVKIGFDNPDETLKPGMTIEVTLPRTDQK